MIERSPGVSEARRGAQLSNDSPSTTWSAVPWRFTVRCSSDRSYLRVVVRPDYRQLSECLYPPLAAWPVGGEASLALRAVPEDDRVVRQHSDRQLRGPRR